MLDIIFIKNKLFFFFNHDLSPLRVPPVLLNGCTFAKKIAQPAIPAGIPRPALSACSYRYRFMADGP